MRAPRGRIRSDSRLRPCVCARRIKRCCDLALEAADYAVVVTHDHAVDQRVIEALLRRPLRFVGMIGSVPKQRKFALRLRARGFTTRAIARMRTPLGVSIGAQTPEEIAVSVMAELISTRRAGAAAAGSAAGETGESAEVPATEARAESPAPAALAESAE